MNPTVPPAASHGMLFLAALSLGVPYRTDGGALAVDVEGAGLQPVPAETLDELEAKGWLSLDGEEPVVTQKGLYTLQKWARVHWKRAKA